MAESSTVAALAVFIIIQCLTLEMTAVKGIVLLYPPCDCSDVISIITEYMS